MLDAPHKALNVFSSLLPRRNCSPFIWQALLFDGRKSNEISNCLTFCSSSENLASVQTLVSSLRSLQIFLRNFYWELLIVNFLIIFWCRMAFFGSSIQITIFWALGSEYNRWSEFFAWFSWERPMILCVVYFRSHLIIFSSFLTLLDTTHQFLQRNARV